MGEDRHKSKEILIAELSELKRKASRLEEAELALRESEERYRRLLESVTDYVYTVTLQDGQAVATTHGDGCREVTGYSAEEYNSDPNLWYNMIHQDDRQMVLTQVGMLQQGLDAPPIEHRIIHKDGSVRWVRATPVIRRDAFGRVAFYDGVIQDITQAKSMEEQIRHAAMHDPLTLLPNRLMLSDRLGRMIGEAKREGEKVAVLFLDLDHFKPINDTLGHAVGDEVLKEVASRLVRHVRGSDTVARVGGDEFVVVLGRQREDSGASDVAKKIIRALSRPYRTLNGSHGPGCSIGITIFPDDGQEPGQLISLADEAMYYVKNHHRGTFSFHSNLSPSTNGH